MSTLLMKSMNLGLLDTALTWVIGAVTTLLMWIVEWTIDLIMLLLADVLYALALTLLDFVDFFQAFFNALCGLGRYWDANGVEFTNQDPILSLVTNQAVLQVFIGMFAVAVVLLMLTTIVAVIRTEFSTEGAKNTKGNIIGGALKSLAMFIAVPVTCVFGIIFSSAVLKMVYTATSGGSNVTAGGMVWYAASYNANRIRSNSIAGLDGISDIIDAADPDASYQTMKKHGYLNDFGATDGGTADEREMVATMVDNAFKSGDVVVEKASDEIKRAAASWKAGYSISDAMNGVTRSGPTYTYKNIMVTRRFYSIKDMNFIVLFMGGGLALYIMFIAAFGLIIRLYKCSILFILSAPICALTPLDGGATYKNWRKLMIGAVCSAFAIVIAFNLVFLLIPIMSEINIFNPTIVVFNTWNRLVQLMFTLTGLYSIKETSKWVAGMLGIEDPLAAGSEISGKVMGAVGKMGAAAGGLIASGVGKTVAAKAAQRSQKALSEAMNETDPEKKKVLEDKARKLDQTAAGARSFSGKAQSFGLRGIQKSMSAGLQKLDDFTGGTGLIGGKDDSGNDRGLAKYVSMGTTKAFELTTGVNTRMNTTSLSTDGQAKKNINAKYGKDNDGYYKLGDDGTTKTRMDKKDWKKERDLALAREKTRLREENPHGNATMTQLIRGENSAAKYFADERDRKAVASKTLQAFETRNSDVSNLITRAKKLDTIYAEDGVGGLKNPAAATELNDIARQIAEKLGMSIQEVMAHLKEDPDTVDTSRPDYKYGDGIMSKALKQKDEFVAEVQNQTVNFGGVNISLMTGDLATAVSQALSSINVEGPDLSAQIRTLGDQLKNEQKKAEAELKKEREKITFLATQIAKMGKKLNPAKK